MHIFKKWKLNQTGEKIYSDLEQGAREILSKDFQIIDLDFYYECMLKGTGKDFITQKVIENLNLDIKNCYFFGDSLNDLSVFKLGGINTAIGHSPQELKNLAHFITTEEENGVYESLCHFGIIKE